MGVSGTGKTTLSLALTHSLTSSLGAEFTFVEGDSLHPPSNIEKMRRGEALGDSERWGWLGAVRKEGVKGWEDWVERHKREEGVGGVIVSCSALKRTYRDVIRGHPRPGVLDSEKSDSTSLDPKPIFVYIKGSRDLIRSRMQSRVGHYFKPNLLESQFAILESPEHEEDVIIVDNEATTEEQVKEVKKGIKRWIGKEV